MTALQEEIKKNEELISEIGYWMFNSWFDSHEKFGELMAYLIADTDEKRKMQEDIFNSMPWLRKAASK